MSSTSSASRFFVAFSVFASLLANAPALADIAFTSQPPTSATVGQSYSYTMDASTIRDEDDDDDGDSDDGDRRLRFIARALPSWLVFDGIDTIVGTPGADDVGQHRVRLRARLGGDSADQDFSINVVAAPSNPPPQRADLGASVTVAPNPAQVGALATWTVTARNLSNTDVGNVVLETVFTGDAPFQIDGIDDTDCAIEPRGGGTAVTCRWAPLSGGASRSGTVTGRASEAGEIVAVATVSIADATPTDGNAGNNDSRVVLSVTETQGGGGPSQALAAPGAVAVAVADFNGDTRHDLAVATGAGEPTLIFLNDPNGSGGRPFTSVPISAGDEVTAGAGIAAGDIDGDGSVDVVVANAGGPNHILFNNGSAGFTTTTLDASAGSSRGVEIDDADGDSLPDIVFANEGQSSLYRNLGNREFQREIVGEGPSASVTTVDLMGDARPEIVFANPDRNAEVYQRVNGTYSRWATLETAAATSAAAADYDADGDADLAFGRGAADLVLLNASGTSPSFPIRDRLGESVTVSVLSGDFDMDGRNDVVSIGASGAHRFYRNDGATEPSFPAQGSGFSGKAATGAAAGLFDAGGVPDVAVAGSDVVAVFLNVGGPGSGGGALGAPVLTLNGQSTVTLTVGDAYQDAGATAVDDVDGNLTDGILVDNPVDTNVIGRYSVTYEVLDSSGNLATATRIVEVQARSPTGGGGGGAAGLALLLLAGCGILVRLASSASSASRRRVADREVSPQTLDSPSA